MQKLIKFLEKNKVKYEKISHRKVYTAFDKTQTLKLPPKIVGKTLIIEYGVGGKSYYGLLLIPADKKLAKNKFKKIVKSKKVELVKESWIKKNLKGVKVGAIPPFGNLWGLPTFIDKKLFKQPKIIINGGDYTLSLKLETKILKKIIPNLIIGDFSEAK